jgi:carbonic anhydrase
MLEKPLLRSSFMFGAFCCVAITAQAETWQSLVSEPGRKIEINMDSIVREGTKATVSSKVSLDTPLDDLRSNAKYQVIETTTKYDCETKTGALIKRTLRKANDEMVREEDGKGKSDVPVRSGTVDERLMIEVCKMPEGRAEAASGDKKSGGAKAEGRGDGAAKSSAGHGDTPATGKKSTRKKKAKEQAVHVHWSYSGEGGPEKWADIDPANRLCREGQRQSPINIEGGLRAELPPLSFNYSPAGFQIIDNGHTIQAMVPGNSLSLNGKVYQLLQLHFHRPSEERINGRAYEMVAHLVHKSDEGDLAVVAVLLQEGQDNPVMKAFWDAIPLEKNVKVGVDGVMVDLNKLLPKEQKYYNFMGSLTTPPCTEGILWVVMKDPVSVSAEQISTFARFYANNARPIQQPAGRLVKESR